MVGPEPHLQLFDDSEIEGGVNVRRGGIDIKGASGASHLHPDFLSDSRPVVRCCFYLTTNQKVGSSNLSGRTIFQ